MLTSPSPFFDEYYTDTSCAEKAKTFSMEIYDNQRFVLINIQPGPLLNKKFIYFSPSYGHCSVYTSETTICNNVLRSGIDYVYAKSKLGNQDAISNLLNEKTKNLKSLISDHTEDCVKQVFRVFCHFYLPPCGNSTHPLPPSSICQEKCHMVQNNCIKTWVALLLAFKDINPIIQCNDTSRLLFPVPHCCTDAGLSQLL